MGKSQLKVANVVASSTPVAWSQTYHAGGVTAVVSVRQKSDEESPALSIVGKDLLNTFESEYFTLETKNLASIKQAVQVTYEKSNESHHISLIVAAVIQNAVYIVLAGTGKVLLIRKGTVATLLEQQDEADVLSASGFLEGGDMMVLATHAFSKTVSNQAMLDAASNNSVIDTAEILSPQIHKEKDGAAAALILSYHEDAETSNIAPIPEMPTEKPDTKAPEEKESQPTPTKIDEEKQHVAEHIIASAEKRKKKTLTHRQKIFLTVAIVLLIVLVGTIWFSLQKRAASQTTALFSQLYPPAESKYQEAQGLQSLNPSLAHDDYTQAQQMLEAAKGKFSAGSKEEAQILALLDKVKAQLTPTNTQPQTAVTKADATASPLLGFAQQNSGVKYISQDDSNFYLADNSGITRVTKSGNKSTKIITNGSDWKTIAGFETYLGNMYVLDSADGIDKYAAGSSGFGNKAPYFTGSTPDLSKAVSMAIDGSVWILTSDGAISQYTKGVGQSFTVSGLSTPLSSPSRIMTSVDDSNLYILDNGNSRLVVLKKDGTFVAQYANDIFKSATQLDVNESAKKTYILSGGTIYEMDLK